MFSLSRRALRATGDRFASAASSSIRLTACSGPSTARSSCAVGWSVSCLHGRQYKLGETLDQNSAALRAVSQQLKSLPSLMLEGPSRAR